MRIISKATILLYFITAGGESGDPVKLYSKSGNHAICQDQDTVYVCGVARNTTTLEVITPNATYDIAILHIDEDVPSSYIIGCFVATLLKNDPNDMVSRVVIPYSQEWNGTVIMCSEDGITNKKNHTHIIAGRCA